MSTTGKDSVPGTGRGVGGDGSSGQRKKKGSQVPSVLVKAGIAGGLPTDLYPSTTGTAPSSSSLRHQLQQNAGIFIPSVKIADSDVLSPRSLDSLATGVLSATVSVFYYILSTTDLHPHLISTWLIM